MCHCVDALTVTLTIVICIKNIIDCKRCRLVNLGWSHTTSLCWPCWPQLSFVSVCRLWWLFGTIFKQIYAQRRAAPGCFGFTRAKGCCDGSFRGFCEKFDLTVVHGCSETRMKRKECGIVVASSLRSIINVQVEVMISVSVLRCCETMRWCGHSVFFKKPKAIIVLLAFLKAGFNKKMRTKPTWLIFCLRNGKTKIS